MGDQQREEKTPTAVWNILIQKAIVDEDKRVVLWPEEFSFERLTQVIRPVMGELAFAREYQNEPAPPGGLRFKPEWIRFYGAGLEREFLDGLDIYIAVDPAIGKTDTSSYFALAVVGYGRSTRRIYVLDLYRAHLRFGEQVKTVARYWNTFKAKVVGIEDIFYQKVLVESLDEWGPLPLKGLKPKKDKIARIDSLGPYFESGKLVFREGITDFERWIREEYLSFPESDHMDGLDALSYAVAMAVEGFSEEESHWIWI